jgi:hypothetical protein
MAIITLTIPDAVLPRVRTALCSKAGLPESNANAKQAVVDFIKATVREVEYYAAVSAQPPIPEPDVSSIVT